MNNTKRLFIVGASALQLPAIMKAKEMGLNVAVADYDPQAVGISFADEYFNISTIDEKAICNAAEEFKADGIMTMATDMPMRSVAYTCEKLGLCGISYETAQKATDKEAMIRAFEANGVEHPWFFVLKSPEDLPAILPSLTYPCICKPTDSSGSRGVALVFDGSEIYDAVLYSADNSRTGRVILEEYLQGMEVSVEIIVHEGKAHVIAVTDKLTTGAPHFVEMGHSQPSQLSLDALSSIEDLACRAAAALNIRSGGVHAEVMHTQNGPKMIELGARLGGDCITSHLVPLSTGVDMVKAVIDIALNRQPDIVRNKTAGAAIRFIPSKTGIISSIAGVEACEKSPNIVEAKLHYGVGDTIHTIKSSTDRIGHVIAKGLNAQDAIASCESALNHLIVTVRTR